MSKWAFSDNESYLEAKLTLILFAQPKEDEGDHSRDLF